MGRKEEKLWRALATPPIELPEEPEVDASVDLAVAPPLDPDERARLVAAALAQRKTAASPGPAAGSGRPKGDAEPPARPAEPVTRPGEPRSRAAGLRWWRRRPWFSTLTAAAVAALALVVAGQGGILDPWGSAATSVGSYRLEVRAYGHELGSPPVRGDPDREPEPVELSLGERLSADLRAEEVGRRLPGVKVWVEQRGLLFPWPVKLVPAPGGAVLDVKSAAPLAGLSSDGIEVAAGPARLLVAVGTPEGLPSAAEVAEVVRYGKPEPKSWHLLRQPIVIVAGGQRRQDRGRGGP